jgi:hypothetical protein
MMNEGYYAAKEHGQNDKTIVYFSDGKFFKADDASAYVRGDFEFVDEHRIDTLNADIDTVSEDEWIANARPAGFYVAFVRACAGDCSVMVYWTGSEFQSHGCGKEQADKISINWFFSLSAAPIVL